jgi:methionyl-tRNA synthetase
LANDLGNLASRTIAMVHRYREGVPPAVALDPQLHEEFAGLAQEVEGMIDRAELTGALDVIWQRVRRLNRYVEERAPWQLAKDDARSDELDRVLATLVAGLRVLGVLLYPYVPSSAEKLLGALGCESRSLECARWDSAQALGQPIRTLEPLFPKSG